MDPQGREGLTKTKVVVIHGALRGVAGLLPTVIHLRRRGFDACAFAYRTRRDSLERHAERLEAFVAEFDS